MPGFQFCGGEIVPIPEGADDAPFVASAARGGENGSMCRAIAPQSHPVVTVQVTEQTVPAQSLPNVKPAKPLTPKDVIKAARARVRELDREINRIEKLRAERDELKRLLVAAQQKPNAVVRELPRAAR